MLHGYPGSGPSLAEVVEVGPDLNPDVVEDVAVQIHPAEPEHDQDEAQKGQIVHERATGTDRGRQDLLDVLVFLPDQDRYQGQKQRQGRGRGSSVL